MAWTKKKRNRMIGLGAAVLCCAGLFTGYALLSEYNKEQSGQETTQAEENEKIFDFTSEDIRKVRFVTEEADLTFTREDTESDWLYAQDKALPVSQSGITGIVTSAAALRINQEIADTLERAADFGLAEPEYQIYLTDKDGKEYGLNIGSTVVSDDAMRYFNVQGTDRIVASTDSLTKKISGDLYAFVDAGQYPEFTYNDMTLIVYEDANQKLELVNNPADLRESEAIGTSQWYYRVENGYQACDYDNSLNLVQTVAGIKFESCVNYNASDEDWKKYGLDAPAASLQVEYAQDADTGETEEKEEHVFTLHIGNAAEDGESYYVNIDDSRCVYLLDSETAELFTGQVLTDYLLSRSPCLLNFNGIRRIVAERDGKKLEITVEQSKGTDENGEETTVYDCTVNGESYEEKETRSIFADLIRMMADHILADGEAKEGTEEVFTCTFYTNYEEKPEVTYTVSEFDSTYYQLSLNGKTKYAVSRQEFNAFLSNLEDFMQ